MLILINELILAILIIFFKLNNSPIIKLTFTDDCPKLSIENIVLNPDFVQTTTDKGIEIDSLKSALTETPTAQEKKSPNIADTSSSSATGRIKYNFFIGSEK